MFLMENTVRLPFSLTHPVCTPLQARTIAACSKELQHTLTSRGHIRNIMPTEGQGKKRPWNALGVIELAILRRTDDLGIRLPTAINFVGAVLSYLEKRGGIDWSARVSFHPTTGASSSGRITIDMTYADLSAYGLITGDAADDRVSRYTESFEGVVCRRRRKWRIGKPKPEDAGRVIPEIRDELARRQIHAEPVIIFPIGEVVNAVLLQLAEMHEAAHG